MSWYYGTFYCGHEGYINLIGPAKIRKKMKEYRFSGLCPECSRAEMQRYRQENNEKASTWSQKWELPPLEGSARQIAWANTLRQGIVYRLQAFIETPSHLTSVIEAAERVAGTVIDLSCADLSPFFQEMLHYLINEKTNSAYWIDNRYESNQDILAKLLPEFQEWRRYRKADDDLEAYASATSLLSPEKQRYSGIVVIKGSAEEIRVYYEKNAEFQEILKSLGYKWNGRCWYRRLTPRSGTWEDRAAELGNALLRQGFGISIDSAYARQHAVDADFFPEQRRWIGRSISGKQFYVAFPPGSSQEELRNIQRIPTASYRYGGVLLDPSRYEELEDFAQTYHFQFDEAAQRLLEQYKAALAAAPQVSPAAKSAGRPVDPLLEILNSSDIIPEDLTDDT